MPAQSLDSMLTSSIGAKHSDLVFAANGFGGFANRGTEKTVFVPIVYAQTADRIAIFYRDKTGKWDLMRDIDFSRIKSIAVTGAALLNDENQLQIETESGVWGLTFTQTRVAPQSSQTNAHKVAFEILRQKALTVNPTAKAIAHFGFPGVTVYLGR